MGKSVYCENCEQKVAPRVDLSGRQILTMIGLLSLFIVPGFVYICYAGVSKKFKRCPLCKSQDFDYNKK